MVKHVCSYPNSKLFNQFFNIQDDSKMIDLLDEFKSFVDFKNVEEFKRLLDSGKHANVSNSERNNPMHLAAMAGKFLKKFSDI